MSKEEFHEAIKLRDEAKLQNGEGERNYISAINSIIEGNVRLIINQAKTYSDRYSVPIEDAISEGVFAVREAAKSYDPSRGRFSTFAIECMKRHFLKRLPIYVNSPTVLTQGQRRDFNLLQKERGSSLDENLGDLESSAKKIGVSRFKAEKLMQAEKSRGSSINDAILNGETRYGDREIGDAVPPYRILGTREINRLAVYELRNALGELNSKEFEIISMHFGLADKPLTLEKIGTIYGVTRERIRQIENKALGKLRKKLSPILEDYFLDCF